MKFHIVAATLALSFMTDAAHAETFKSQYSISAIGLKVGSSSFETTVNGDAYTVKGSMRAAGIASLFSSMSGNLTASGKVAKTDILPDEFFVSYEEDGKKKSTAISFSSGKVTKAVNRPASKPKGKWVKLEPGHMNGTVDPIAAMMVPARNHADVCKNTMSVFDGVMRADFPMQYLRTIPFSTDGYKGDAVTCRVSFRPVGGYDAGKKDVIYMRDKANIEVSFAPVGTSGFYAPVAAKTSTRIGTINVRATRFETVSN